MDELILREQIADETAMSRRAFLQGTGLLLGFALTGASTESVFAAPASQVIENEVTGTFAPNGFIRINPTGAVTLVMPMIEMGQGVYTSLSMLLAEELEVKLDQIQLQHAPPNHALYVNSIIGIQNTGGSASVRAFWTPLRRAGNNRRKAAWLYLQFIVSKSVSLKKSHVGLTFIRESDIWDKSFTERAPKLGGLIEFYRSPARVQWSPTGNNIPDYPKLAQLWWQNIGDASSGAKTAQAAMDSLAAAQDSVLERLEKSGVQGACGPKLNKKETAEFWFAKSEKDGNIAPQRKLANEKPKGETIDYDTLIKSWPASPPKRAAAN